MRDARYRLYGLTIQTGLILPVRRIRAGAHDVRVERADLRTLARARATALKMGPWRRDWFHCRRLPDRSTYLEWTNLFAFLIDPDGRRVRYHTLRSGDRESLTTYLLGQVLSFPLLAAGHEPLHATTLVSGGEAFGLLGGCGWGKSTLGAALFARGSRLLTDDLLVVTRTGKRLLAHPGIPRLKLFPRVSRAILGSGAGGRMNPGTAKRVVPIPGDRAVPGPVSLRALYVLSDPGRPVKRITLAPLSRAEAMLQLVRSTYNTIVVDRGRLANQFRFATALVGTVPLKRLSYPRTWAALPDVCDVILSDLKTAPAPL